MSASSSARLAAACAALAAAAVPAARAQGGASQGADGTLAILLASIAAVVALALYVSRSAIMRRKTDYDRGDYASKEDRTAEKYGSGWHDDYEGPRAPQEGGGDHYATLGLERGASAAEIKERYRELAKRHHPDRGGGDAAELARINAAYEVLSDAEARKRYDESL